jgi:hypothetical protein
MGCLSAAISDALVGHGPFRPGDVYIPFISLEGLGCMRQNSNEYLMIKLQSVHCVLVMES